MTSYNIPQGMVRGSTLELLDITYDGMEDQVGMFCLNKDDIQKFQYINPFLLINLWILCITPRKGPFLAFEGVK